MVVCGIRCAVPSRQGGAVLLVSLILLAALTLVGLSAASEARLQTRLAANRHETAQARQSALATLAAAEAWLLDKAAGTPGPCGQACAGPGLLPGDGPTDAIASRGLDWWLANGHAHAPDPDASGKETAAVATRGVWLAALAHRPDPPRANRPDGRAWYRLLARGAGPAGKAVSVVESLVVVAGPPGDADAHAVGPGQPPERSGRVAFRVLR